MAVPVILLLACADPALDPAERDRDGDGWSRAEGDCDDGDAAVSPGAAERCDGADQDCDGAIDEGATDAVNAYTDVDGDGFGDPASATAVCSVRGERITDGTDCDDADPAVHPGATEWCDGADEDCDGAVDDDAADASAWYPDLDGDGHGVGTLLEACEAPAGYAAIGDDCDDSAATVSPTSPEVCDNGVDDDCDGTPNGCGIDGEMSTADADGFFDHEGRSQGFATFAAAVDLVGGGESDLLLSSEWGVYVIEGPAVGDHGVAAAAVSWTPAGTESVYGFVYGPDLDRDGEPNVIIAEDGGRNADGGFVSNGGVYVLPWSQPSGSLEDAPAHLSGEPGSDAGASIAVAGDTEGDGLDRVLVGSQGSVLGDDGLGVVWFVSEVAPGESSLADAEARLVSEEAHDGTGLEVAGLGDVDGDGLADVAVAAVDADLEGVAVGRALLLLGPIAGRTSLAQADGAYVPPATDATCRYGKALAGAQDLDGDGLDDVVMGSQYCDLVYVYAEGGAVTGAYSAIVVGDPEFGLSLASVGDVDGDGHDDLLVGDPWGASSYRGVAWLFAGPITAGFWDQGDARAAIYGQGLDELFGYQIHGLGDVDADGYHDLLGSSASGAWLFLGGEM